MKKTNAVIALICAIMMLAISPKTYAYIPSPKLVFDSDGTEHAIKLKKLKVNIEIMGNIALTTMDMTFFPDSTAIPERLKNREFEGNLIFPLADGQTVSKLSMEINGIMRRGVVVEKEKGRVIFEDLERKNIDPALLEKTSANAYKLRIYPIRLNESKRIIVQYEEVIGGKNLSQSYRLPLKYDYAIDSISIFADVYSNVPVEFDYNHSIEGMSFKDEGECYSTAKILTNYQPNELIAIDVPEQEDENRVLIEKGNDGENYFSATYFFESPKPKLTEVKKMAVYWDCSHSARDRDLMDDLSLLSYAITSPNCEVTVYTFNYKVKSKRTFKVKDGNTGEILEYLENLKYDGASNFDCIKIPKGEYDLAMLFSDGITSIGESKLVESPIPLYVVSSQVMINESYLEEVASKSGGLYINALEVIGDKTEWLLPHQNYRLISVEYPDGTIEDVYPKSVNYLDISINFVGKVKAKSAKLKLNFGYGNEIYKTEEVTISGDAVDTKILERIWAKKKIDYLAMDRKKNRAAIIDIAKKHSIVTQETSLLVLESHNDYIRYNLEPPKEEKDIYEQYMKAMQLKKTRANEEDGKYNLENLITEFEARKKWYDTDFIAKMKKFEELRKKMGKKSVEETLAGMTFDSEAEREEAREYLFRSRDYGGYGSADDADMRVESAPAMMMNEPSSRSSNARIASAEQAKSLRTNSSPQPEQTASVTLGKYDSSAPYFAEFKQGTENFDTLYYRNKNIYGNTIGYYIDIAEILSEKNEKERAAEVISNIAELSQDNQEFLRIVAYKLQYLGEIDLAIKLLEFIKEIRGEEPQSYRDLAMVYEEKGEYQKACDLLYEMALKKWNGRFRGINLTAITEMNAIIAKHKDKVNTAKYDARLISPMPLDMRVVLRWDLDNTDIDLWVTDPNSEKCFYGHKNTKIGGLLPQDLTGGYGPEEFLLRQAIEGRYLLQCNYFGSRSVQMAGGATIFLDLYTNYGKPNEKKETTVMRLRQARETVKIGEYEFKSK